MFNIAQRHTNPKPAEKRELSDHLSLLLPALIASHASVRPPSQCEVGSIGKVVRDVVCNRSHLSNRERAIDALAQIALPARIVYFDLQVTCDFGTVPSLVGGAKVQETVNSVAGGEPCCTVRVAPVNDRSVMLSVQCEFGQPGAPGIGVTGGLVVTLNDTLPFFTSEAGIASEPETDTGAGFCPGG